jgi:hypothetical protein
MQGPSRKGTTKSKKRGAKSRLNTAKTNKTSMTTGTNASGKTNKSKKTTNYRFLPSNNENYNPVLVGGSGKAGVKRASLFY